MLKGPNLVTEPLRRGLKWLRRKEVANRPITTGVRALLTALHRQPPQLVVRHLHRQGAVSVRLPNGETVRMKSDGGEVANLVFWRGWDAWDPAVSEVLYRCAGDARVIIDVGAHIGVYSLIMALANRSASVYSFEPHPSAFHRLEDHVRLSGLENVTTFRCAVSDHGGRAALFTDGSEVPMVAALAPVPGSHQEVLDVEVVALDEALPKSAWAAVDLIKIDTEGTEPDVLRGSRRVLSLARPLIVCEVLPTGSTGAEIEQLLPEGYLWYQVTPQGVMRRQGIRPTEDLNWLLVPEERREALHASRVITT